VHIILYVLDALRPDHLSCYGYDRETSPHIDALARDGVLFENCFTSSTWTRPVAASILTGCYPGVHLTRSRYDAFSSSLTRLPELLRAGGFSTAAFSTMGNLASEIGFDKGFDRYCDLFREPPILAKRRKRAGIQEGMLHAPDERIALPRAEDVNDYLFAWLEDNHAIHTFSFIWSIETHEPYTPPDEFRRFSGSSHSRPGEGERRDIRSAGAPDRRRLIDLYDDGILYNDHCIGQIVDRLKELAIYDDTCFIVVSDHGDAFYEHGTYGHGHAPYEELIHVPMIMKLPGRQYAGQRVAALAELIDIFPTVVAVAGLAHGSAGGVLVQGHNLVSLLESPGRQLRQYVFSDTQSLEVLDRYLSVRGQRWKYVQLQRPKRGRRTLWGTIRYVMERRMVRDILSSPRHFLRRYLRRSNEWLFDLEADPDEQHNRAMARSHLTSEFRQVLKSWQEHNEELVEQLSIVSYSYEESESLRRHLEELGYM
jgi:arylsulfatase A-like enzyme